MMRTRRCDRSATASRQRHVIWRRTARLRQADHARITVTGAVSNDFRGRQPLIPDRGAANQVIREFGPLSIYGTRPASMKPDNEFFSSDRYLEKVNNLT